MPINNKVDIVDIRRGLRPSRLFKNKQITPRNFASGVDLLIPDAAYGPIEANSKIDLPGFIIADAQGFDAAAAADGEINVVAISASAGTATTYGTLTGALNGSNTVFVVAETEYISGTSEVYLNGQKQVVGVDYTESAPSIGQITMTIAPDSTDILIVATHKSTFTADLKYATSDSDNANSQVVGLINSANKIFTTPGPYKTGTLRVYLDGQLLTQGTGEDWTETTSTTFTFITAPDSPDVVSVSYEAADGLRRYETTEDTLSYTFNGTNTTGTLSGPYEPGTLELDWNGQLLTPGADYAETNPALGTFDTVTAKASGIIQAAYDVGASGVAVGERTRTESITANYTMTIYDRSVEADATGGAFTVKLPKPADVQGMEFNVIKIDASVNGVTIEGIVNGVTNPVITIQNNSLTMRPLTDETGYFLV